MSCAGCAERAQKLKAYLHSVIGRSGKLPPPPSLVTREAIVAEARDWIGTPFHHQAFRKGAGCDCIGLVAGVGLALGIDGAREWHDCEACHQYGRPPNPRFLVEMANRFLVRREIGNWRLADILVMSFEREPMHFAIVSGRDPLSVVHALFGAGETVEHRIDQVWAARVRMCYGYRGIE
jgi:cell wall-associated NlpC family hydrolase